VTEAKKKLRLENIQLRKQAHSYKSLHARALAKQQELEGKASHRWWVWVVVSSISRVYLLKPSRGDCPRPGFFHPSGQSDSGLSSDFGCNSHYRGEWRPRESPSQFAARLKKRLYQIMRQGWSRLPPINQPETSNTTVRYSHFINHMSERAAQR